MLRTVALFALVIAGGAAETPSWPMVTGPRGDWSSPRSGHHLVPDFDLVRLAWMSEPVLGRVRIGRTAAGAAARGQAVPQPGSCSSPIVAGGKVFITDYQPAGETVVKKDAEGLDAVAASPFRVAADDVLVAIDAATGRLAWRAVEPGLGINRWGGKRTAYGPAAAWLDGAVFSLGTTGMLYAYDAATGAKRWQTATPGHTGMLKAREKAIATGTAADGPLLQTSLVVLPGRVIASDCRAVGYTAVGLCAFDPAEGRQLWHVPGVVHQRGTPVIVRPEGAARPLLLAHSGEGGVLTCIDPADGAVLWKVEGLGPMIGSLTASDRTVLVNVAPPRGKGPAQWGAYRLSASGAERVWTLPEDLSWGWGYDAGARRKIAFRDGQVLITELGGKPEQAVIVREEDGEVVWRADQAEDPARRAQLQHGVPRDGTPRFVEDRLLIAVDEAHGAAKTPVAFDHWQWIDGRPVLRSKNWQPEVDPATGYEVLLEWPYVDGFLYSRTGDGRIACYDLRRPGGQLRRHDLALVDGYHGLPDVPLPLRLFEVADALLPNAAAYPPDEAQAGLVFGKDRRFARWERAVASGLRRDGARIAGEITIDHGTGTWPVRLDLALADGAWSGTWTRRIPGMAQPITGSGAIGGRGALPQRMVATPWLKDSPWTSREELPAGTTCWVLELQGVFPREGRDPAAVTVYLDHDGRTVRRCLATAFGKTTAWHEGDARGLTIADGRVAGRLELCFNADRWAGVAPSGSTGAIIDIDATLVGDALSGTWTGTIGVPLEWSGSVRGVTTAIE